MKENYFLDDGAYLAVQILIQLMRCRLSGSASLIDLLNGYKEAAESHEIRLKITTNDFKGEGEVLLESFRELVESGKNAHWSMEKDNHEGWRISVDEGEGRKGWMLLRQSLHDPLMVINVESDVDGGCKPIVDALVDWLQSSSFQI